MVPVYRREDPHIRSIRKHMTCLDSLNWFRKCSRVLGREDRLGKIGRSGRRIPSATPGAVWHRCSLLLAEKVWRVSAWPRWEHSCTKITDPLHSKKYWVLFWQIRWYWLALLRTRVQKWSLRARFSWGSSPAWVVSFRDSPRWYGECRAVWRRMLSQSVGCFGIGLLPWPLWCPVSLGRWDWVGWRGCSVSGLLVDMRLLLLGNSLTLFFEFKHYRETVRLERVNLFD